VQVVFDYIGEGYNGDFNVLDLDDKPLVRFSVYFKGEAVDDASYCTCLSAFTKRAYLLKKLNIILDEVYEDVINGNSIKKICENLSWIE
jgi:hypothetical protein